MNLRFCLHPDRIAAEKDDALRARLTDAARTLAEFEPVLVNKEAEEQKKRSDAASATFRWKVGQAMQKRDAAKREAAAAKRASRRAKA